MDGGYKTQQKNYPVIYLKFKKILLNNFYWVMIEPILDYVVRCNTLV